jgi:hypothetical protein
MTPRNGSSHAVLEAERVSDRQSKAMLGDLMGIVGMANGYRVPIDKAFE